MHIAEQLLRTVHYLHSVGFIDPKTKAENVLVTSSNVVNLADFGLEGSSMFPASVRRFLLHSTHRLILPCLSG